jgi:hypothetical protein
MRYFRPIRITNVAPVAHALLQVCATFSFGRNLPV